MARSMFTAAPAPLTGVCTICAQRVKVKKDGKLWRHQRRQREPSCPGSGQPPRAGSVKPKWPSRGRGSVRAVSGGAIESDRRRHLARRQGMPLVIRSGESLSSSPRDTGRLRVVERTSVIVVNVNRYARIRGGEEQ